MWTCPNCRETVDDDFAVCWNCGSDRAGNADPEFEKVADVVPDAADTSQPVTVAGRQLVCRHCDHDRFQHGTFNLKTMAIELFDIPWLRTAADVYTCSNCGLVEWFIEPDVL